jgi:HD-like signal output (HDOD) protein
MRVLFIDDETRVLEALERVLLELEDSWETCFLGSGEAALNELSRQQYDVVVSDLRMAGMDGVTLLSLIAELHPRTARIVLSGHSDEEAALKMVHVAHQFLAKPCAAQTLHQVIARTAKLTQLLPDRKLQTLVGQVRSLPSPPAFHQQLADLVERGDETSPAGELACLIKADPAMTAKLLQVSSSAFFNTSASVADVETAIMRLGFRTLRNLSHALCDFVPARPSSMPTITAVQALQQRAVEVAVLAAGMARLPEDASAAYIAGLLSTVGELVLISAAPERLYVTQAEAAQSGVPSHVAELSTWGVTHAEIGAYLLGLWGLPVQIVEAVANHHAPARGDSDRLGLAQLVWLASCIESGEEPTPELLHRFGAEALFATQRRAFQESKS